jgi:hypothetical protein
MELPPWYSSTVQRLLSGDMKSSPLQGHRVPVIQTGVWQTVLEAGDNGDFLGLLRKTRRNIS